jgi:DnaK suppressor protein
MELDLEYFRKLFTDVIKNYPYEELDQFGDFSSGRDEIDRLTEERERNLFLKLKSRGDFYRRKVTQALQRIEEGTFGECQDCGATISKERLLARPTATLCIHCKEEQEGAEKHIPYGKKSRTHGMALSNSLKLVKSGDDNDDPGTTELNQKILKFNQMRIGELGSQL